MRVLHVDPERGWGGGEVQVALLVRELAPRDARGAAGRLRGGPRGGDAARFGAGADARAALRAGWGAREADVVAIVVGVLEAREGHAALIEAAARLGTGSSLRLVFCG